MTPEENEALEKLIGTVGIQKLSALSEFAAVDGKYLEPFRLAARILQKEIQRLQTLLFNEVQMETETI